MEHEIFISGGTGYIGSALIPALVKRGHRVKALARPGSERRLAAGVDPVLGNALDARSFAAGVPPADTFVHMVGVPHPAPWKARLFEEIDLTALRASLEAAQAAGIQHFLYLSVAQPAPAMRAYVASRTRGEKLIRVSRIPATFVRPWYVLGRGHRWPWILVPFYALAERIPATRDGARRLGMVTLAKMVRALVWAVENPPVQPRVLDVPAIRAARPLPAP